MWYNITTWGDTDEEKIVGILLISIIVRITTTNSLAYSDELFEFDLPNSYVNMSYQEVYVFSDANKEDRGLVIYARENKNIKKSVWDIEQSV